MREETSGEEFEFEPREAIRLDDHNDGWLEIPALLTDEESMQKGIILPLQSTICCECFHFHID